MMAQQSQSAGSYSRSRRCLCDSFGLQDLISAAEPNTLSVTAPIVAGIGFCEVNIGALHCREQCINASQPEWRCVNDQPYHRLSKKPPQQRHSTLGIKPSIFGDRVFGPNWQGDFPGNPAKTLDSSPDNHVRTQRIQSPRQHRARSVHNVLKHLRDTDQRIANSLPRRPH